MIFDESEVNILIKFEENVRNTIKQKGLKQRYVAQRIGVSEKTFSAMLTGRQNILVDDVEKICDVLDVTPNDLFGYSTLA